MNRAKLSLSLVAVAGVIFLLFDVDFVFDIAAPGSAEIPDPAVEADYAACYQAEDHRIHATAFGTIDNPDVQKEFIIENRARAASECRAAHPQKMLSVATPARFHLVDLTPRFW